MDKLTLIAAKSALRAHGVKTIVVHPDCIYLLNGMDIVGRLTLGQINQMIAMRGMPSIEALEPGTYSVDDFIQKYINEQK